jgi:hypothetical protein
VFFTQTVLPSVGDIKSYVNKGAQISVAHAHYVCCTPPNKFNILFSDQQQYISTDEMLEKQLQYWIFNKSRKILPFEPSCPSCLEFVPKFSAPILAVVVAKVVGSAAPHPVEGVLQLSIGTLLGVASSVIKLTG